MTMGRAEEGPSGDDGGARDACGADDGGRACGAAGAGDRCDCAGERMRVLFEGFVRAQRKRTLRRLKALGIGRADAEELFQEGLLKLWVAREQVAAEAWAGWLRGAIANDAHHARRSYARAEKNEAALTHQLRLDLWTAGLGPELLLGTMEVGAELERLVESLGARRREVARLHFLEGLDLPVVAEQLGLSADAAKSLWRLARRDLRAAVVQRRARERFRAGGFASFAFLLWVLERGWALRERWERWERWTGRSRPAAALAVGVALAAAFMVRHSPGAPLVAGEALAVDAAAVVVGEEPALPTASASPGAFVSLASPASHRERSSDPGPREEAAHKVRSIDAGPSEEALIRLAVQAMTRSPARTLALLNEHALRFPASNVALRTELRRRVGSSVPGRGAPARAGEGAATGRP